MKHLLGALSVLVPLFHALAGAPSFPPGACVVWLGDSITHGGYFHRYIELFYATRYPAEPRTFINAGIGGDHASGGRARLEWDVLPHHPTTVSIMFGMNDVGRHLYLSPEPTPEQRMEREARLRAYGANLAALVETLQSRGLQVILATPSPHDDTMISDPPVFSSVNDGLSHCVRIVREVAEERGVPVVDVFNPLLELNLARQARDPAFTIVGKDRVHPGPPGHFVMAFHYLRAQRATAVVSRIEIDAAAARVALADRAAVHDLMMGGGALQFRVRADALPFPGWPGVEPAWSLVPFHEELNREELRVTGLPPAVYEVGIDGRVVATCTEEVLAIGLELGANTNTPQFAQAVRVAELVMQKAAIEQKLRDIAFTESRVQGLRPGPVKPKQMKKMLADVIARLDPKNPHSAGIEKRYRAYPGQKKQERAWREELLSLREKIKSAADPCERRYEIRPLATRHI